MSTKNHIYFVPGLAASTEIFEHLDFSAGGAEVTYLDWLIPSSKREPIETYSQRMCDRITHAKPILIGVSFGGVMVQEMSKLIDCEKVIIISSIKSKNEMPRRMMLTRKYKMYRLFPVRLVRNIDRFEGKRLGPKVRKRVALYKKYLSMRDETYLPWAIYQMLHWKQNTPLKNIIHIHGDDDQVFPIKYIKNCQTVKGGTHVMVLNRAKKITQLIQSNL